MDTMNRSIMIARKPFVAALRQCASVVKRRNSLPILDTVHLIARHDGLILRATDLDRELEITLPSVDTTLDVCAPLYDLLAIARELLGDNATLEPSGTGLCINGAAYLPVQPSDDFPRMERRAPVTEFDLPSDCLKKLLSTTHIAISTDESRWYLNGIFLEPDKNTLRATTTDGRRLISTAVPAPAEIAALADKQRYGIILPRSSVETLLKLMPKKPASIHVVLHADDRLSFHGDNWQYMTRLIDGAFPDWRRVVPGLHNSRYDSVRGRVVMDATEMRAALSVVMANEKKGGVVKYAFDEKTCTLSSISSDSSSAQQTVGCEWLGDLPVLPFTIGFNAGYMRDFLAQQSGTIEWQFQRATRRPEVTALLDPGGPVRIIAGVDPETIYVLMPYRAEK